MNSLQLTMALGFTLGTLTLGACSNDSTPSQTDQQHVREVSENPSTQNVDEPFAAKAKSIEQQE